MNQPLPDHLTLESKPPLFLGVWPFGEDGCVAGMTGDSSIKVLPGAGSELGPRVWHGDIGQSFARVMEKAESVYHEYRLFWVFPECKHPRWTQNGQQWLEVVTAYKARCQPTGPHGKVLMGWTISQREIRRERGRGREEHALYLRFVHEQKGRPLFGGQPYALAYADTARAIYYKPESPIESVFAR